MVSVPILGLSTFGIFVFLGSLESASIICYRILTEGETILTLFLSYVLIHLAITILTGLPINVLLLCIIAYCMIETGKDYENYLNTKESEKSSLRTD